MKKISGYHKMLLIIAIFSLCLSFVLNVLGNNIDIVSILIYAVILFLSITSIYICIKAAIVQHIDLKNRHKEREKLRRYKEMENIK